MLIVDVKNIKALIGEIVSGVALGVRVVDAIDSKMYYGKIKKPIMTVDLKKLEQHDVHINTTNDNHKYMLYDICYDLNLYIPVDCVNGEYLTYTISTLLLKNNTYCFDSVEVSGREYNSKTGLYKVKLLVYTQECLMAGIYA